MVEQTPATAPDLSRLDRETRIRIAVAQVQGATWGPARGGAADAGEWWLEGPCLNGIFWYRPGVSHNRFALPNYLHDPAAWGALMEAERISLFPSVDGWYAIFPAGIHLGYLGLTAVPTVTVSTYQRAVRDPSIEPGEAVCAAVLAKHGVSLDLPVTATGGMLGGEG